MFIYNKYKSFWSVYYSLQENFTIFKTLKSQIEKYSYFQIFTFIGDNKRICIYSINSNPTQTSKFIEYEKLIELQNSRKSGKGSTLDIYKKSKELYQQFTINTRPGKSFEIIQKNGNFENIFC
ncbi:unnamed protein product [Paramecium pentaurelia]|uniref:Uncharacterized protein n=1 Tax=Paramecium pentaurelia TaxID=43138 RepID=A0A8S1UPX5_9CILI|nr:unnamed protein product [Paramecium pentaurelia]